MNRLLQIGISVAVTGCCVAAVPESDEGPQYVFDGQLGYREPGGALVPVVPDKVLVGWGAGRCQFTLQSEETVEISREGTFRLFVSEDTVAVERFVVIHSDGSADPPTCAETKSWPCYRFRAEGCDDAILEFGPKPPSRVVEIECPGRVHSRRDG